ncbi:MAG TPA: hypothetical protein V6D50_23665, partial [Chroococcales cyanobacterium]
MAILHGSWILDENNGYLFIWGETWRTRASVETTPIDGAAHHPFAMTQAELTAFLQAHNLAIGEFMEVSGNSGKGSRNSTSQSNAQQWQTQVLALPTQPPQAKEPAYPALSTQMTSSDADASPLELQLWCVEGFCLTPPDTVKFLQAIPLGSFQASDTYVGGELRFWSQVMRWSLDLLTRCKFLPGLYQKPTSDVVARWQPLLDSAVDQARLEKFTQLMPSACRAYQGVGKEDTQRLSKISASSSEPARQSSTPNPKSLIQNLKFPEPQELLLGFLSSAIDVQIRSWIESQAIPTVESPMQEWLRMLSTSSDTQELPTEALARLETALSTWTTPVQQNIVAPTTQTLGQNLWRTCFALKPPASGETNWRLEYCLQAVDNPD